MPAQDAWLLVAEVRPSTDWELYDSDSSGVVPKGASGTVIGRS